MARVLITCDREVQVTHRNTQQDAVDAAFRAAKLRLREQQIVDLARRGRTAPESLAPHEVGRLCDFVLALCADAKTQP